MVTKLEKHILTVLEYIVAIFIVLECRSVYLYSIDVEYYIMQILGISMICLFTANIIFKKISIKDIISDYKFIFFVTIYNLVFIIALKMKIAEAIRFLYIFEAMFLMLYIYYKTNKGNVNNLLKKIVNVVVIVSLISLFFYVFGTILNLIPTTGTFKMTWGDFGKKEYVIDSYFNIHFNVQRLDVFGMSLYRNTSIFTEGPMFALNLIIAMTIQLFILKEKNWIKTFILIITILTTISTAGILGCILCLTCYFLNNNSIKRILKKRIHEKKTIVICILIIVILSSVIVSLLRQKMQTASYSTRIDDYIASIFAWKDNIIFGNGIFNEQAIINYMSENRKVNTGVSNSFATTLAGGGIYLSLIYIYAYCTIIENYKKNKDSSILCFFIIMIFLGITTVYQYTITMINIMAFTIAMHRKEIKKKKQNVILIDFSKLEKWEFKEELNEITNLKWEEIEFVSNGIRKRRFSNLGRYLKYFLFPLKIFMNRKRYVNIIAWQQFYGLLYACYCRIFHTKKCNNLIIMTFIYKQKNGFLGKLYYQFMKYAVQSKYIDKFVCFSKKECEYYANIFKTTKEKFKFCTLGIEKIEIKESSEQIKINDKEKTIISCGRSNRDYEFLYNALKDTDYKLDIISDECRLPSYKNINIYNDVNLQAFLNILNKSYIVIVPLKNANISAGQLVILQSMQLGKPVICVNSTTVEDYIENGVNGFIIKKDKDSLIKTIEKLYSNDELYNKISKKQKEIFEQKFTQKELARQVSNILKQLNNI